MRQNDSVSQPPLPTAHGRSDASRSVPHDSAVGRPRAAIVIAIGVAVSLLAGLIHVAAELLEERRDLLVRSVESELTTSVGTVAALVGERARDLRSDLTLASDIAARAAQQAHLDDLVRSHLIALNRANKQYSRLYFVRQRQVVMGIAGFRISQDALPEVDAADVLDVADRARTLPGKIVTRRLVAPFSPALHALSLFALADKASAGVVVAAVNMDLLFDTLQRRARLPGTDLWVVDATGEVLVDPGTEEDREEFLNVLTSDVDEGSIVLGPLPSLWPFGNSSQDSHLLAWRVHRGATFRWTTGVAASLRSVQAEIRAVGARLAAVVLALVLCAVTVIGASLVVNRRTARLQERLAHLDTVAGLREQLIRTEKMSSFGLIAAGVAHEIGTPLGVIAIRLDQLRERSSDPGNRAKIDVMKEQIARITRIMRQLLDYARPQIATPEPVSLNAATYRVAALLEHRFTARDVQLEIAIPPAITVRAELDQLHQVLLNLLVNACDACQGGGLVTVSLALAGDDARYAVGPQHVGIVVRDTGQGIPSNQLDAIFEPFYTSKARGEGTGLGLTIVKSIVERHGGDVSVSSENGSTEFVVRWPLWRDTADGHTPRGI